MQTFANNETELRQCEAVKRLQSGEVHNQGHRSQKETIEKAEVAKKQGRASLPFAGVLVRQALPQQGAVECIR